MSDSYNNPQSHHGPHPTVIGNMLDPQVNADGAKSGLGVGGTDERTVVAEGAEHVGHQGQTYGHKEGPRLGQGYGTSGSTGVGSGSDYQSGTGSGYTGTTGTSSTGTYNDTTSSSGGIVGTIKNTLGLGSTTEGTSTGVGSDYQSGTTSYGSTTGSTTGYGNQTGSTGYGSTTGNTAGNTTGTGYDSQTGTHSHHGAQAGLAAGAAGAAYEAEDSTRHGHHHGSTSGRDNIQTTSTSTDPARNTERNAAPVTDSDVTTGRDPTTSADPHTANTAQGQSTNSSRTDTTDTSGTTHPKDPRAPTIEEANAESDGKGGPPTNIPMAGNERIGTKHWGESKVISDRAPRPEESAADDLTKKNTATNTTSHEGEAKESVVDKIKDKLHMGHK